MADEEKKISVNGEIVEQVKRKIGEAENVLIALSVNPSVDELAAAIGLSLFLDRIGKKATAIYSGATPNALEFLKPEKTFSDSVETLQDFVIALNKEKADHLRYRTDGDYVKIFITPYRDRIVEGDLEFSYGDYNIDLVLALDVANGTDLDAALREHGRIMHDATIVNITNGEPGKLGEIEWSDKDASAVSEMLAKMLMGDTAEMMTKAQGKEEGMDVHAEADSAEAAKKEPVKIEKEEATAFLTGIVAATDRFKNENTTPETMTVASKLMELGADQQLISKNVAGNEGVVMPKEDEKESAKDENAKEEAEETKDEPIESEPEEVKDEPVVEEKTDEVKPEEEKTDEAKPEEPEEPEKEAHDDGALLADLKAAQEELGMAPAEDGKEPSAEEEKEAPAEEKKEASAETPAENTPAEVPAENAPVENTSPSAELGRSEKVIQPMSSGLTTGPAEEDNDKYKKMIEDALGGGVMPPVASASAADAATNAPAMSAAGAPAANAASAPTMGAAGVNPAMAGAPAVASQPEINGVPEMNFMPMPGDEVLPPPPTPPIGLGASPAMPAMAPTPATTPMPNVAPVPTASAIPGVMSPAMGQAAPDVANPATGVNTGAPQMNAGTPPVDPGAFKIPGM